MWCQQNACHRLASEWRYSTSHESDPFTKIKICHFWNDCTETNSVSLTAATGRAAPSPQCPAMLRRVHVVDKWCHRTFDPDAHQAVLSWVGAAGKEAVESILWGLIIIQNIKHLYLAEADRKVQTYSGAINHGDEESWNFTGIHQTVAEIFQPEPKQCCPILIHTHTCTHTPAHTLLHAASDCSRQTDWWVTSEPAVVSLCKQLERLGRAGWFSQPDTLEIHTGSIQ